MSEDPQTSLDRLIGDGNVCRIFNADIAYHAWPATAGVGDTCQCGRRRVKRIRKVDGGIVSVNAGPVSEIPRLRREMTK